MPVAETTPALHAAVVVERQEPAPGIVVLRLQSHDVARTARPGQFVMVVPPGGVDAAVALAVFEVEGREFSLMLFVVGLRTKRIAACAVGTMVDLFGPLGNGFDATALGGDVAIVAGGVGIASLLLLAQAIVRTGARAHLYYGARTAAALVGADGFAAAGVTASLATDDGSAGHRGYVTDLLANAARRHSGIAACGPMPMLRTVATIAERSRVPAQLSLEEAFGCGVGACWGCAVRHVTGADGTPLDLIGRRHQLPSVASAALPQADAGERFAYLRVCREGPVFWAHALRW